MAKLLYKLATGDDVYLYDKSIVIMFTGKRKVLSTSVYNGGYHEDFTAIYNHDAKIAAGMPCEILAPTYTEHMALISKRLELDPQKTSGMATAANMENVAIETMSHKKLTVTAIVTAGIRSNSGRAGDFADYYEPKQPLPKFGTINIMLVLNCNLPKGTLVRALVTCSEAKAVAIEELQFGSNYSNGIATGSGTDQTMIVANAESDLYLDDSGKHSKLGELIGKVIIKAVKSALDKQNNLNPSSQHNAILRLKRFGTTAEKLWQLYIKNHHDLIKAQYLIKAEALARDKIMLTYTALMAHLIDEFNWQLIDNEELYFAGETLLNNIAKPYAISLKPIIITQNPDNLLLAWQQLFNDIIAK